MRVPYHRRASRDLVAEFLTAQLLNSLPLLRVRTCVGLRHGKGGGMASFH